MPDSEGPANQPIQPIQQVRKKPPGKLWKRILAGCMAFLLIASMAMSWAVQIRFEQMEYLGTVLEHAAAVTEENTEYLSESSLKRAWNILRYAVGKPKSFDDYEMYASLAIARKEYGEAIQYMQGCIDLYSGESQNALGVLYLRLGSLYALTEDSQSAITSFDKALELVPGLADAYLLRAQMYAILEDMDQAVADIRHYEELAGDDPTIRASIGTLYESAGEYENAVACYTVGIEQATSVDPELLASRARCYLLLGKTAEAKKDLDRFFAEGGTDPTGERNAMLGTCCMEAEEYERAIRSFHNALTAGYAQKALLYSQCVLCAYITGDYETVITDGEKALAAMNKTDSQSTLPGGDTEGLMSKAELHQWIGLAKMAKEDFSGAREQFLAIEELGEAPEGVLYYMGLCSASLGDNEEAVACYSQSIERDELTSLCYYNRGVSYLQMEKLEEGLTDLITVMQRNDDADATAAAEQLLSELGIKVVVENEQSGESKQSK